MAEIAFSSVGEVQAVLLKRLLVFLEKIRHWVLFILKGSESTVTGLCCKNVLSLSFSRLYYVFLLMYLKTMNRWRMF